MSAVILEVNLDTRERRLTPCGPEEARAIIAKMRRKRKKGDPWVACIYGAGTP